MFMLNIQNGNSITVEPKDRTILVTTHHPFTGNHYFELTPGESQSLATALRVYGELAEL